MVAVEMVAPRAEAASSRLAARAPAAAVVCKVATAACPAVEAVGAVVA